MDSKRRTFLGTLGAAALGGSGFLVYDRVLKGPQRVRITQRPARSLNILFVLTDQERSWAQLPKDFIDKHCPNRAWLRDNGVYVSGANTTTQLCSMARGTIYTGTHAPTNGLWENTPLPYSDGLRRDLPTMGSIFQDAGYRTGYAGKWHLTHMESERAKPDPDKIRRTVQGYGFDEVGLTGESDGANAGLENDALAARRAADFIGRRKGTEQPWMLAVNLTNPHDIMYYTSGEEMTRSRVSQFPDQSARPPNDPFYQTDLGYDVFGSWGPATLAGKPEAVLEFNKTMDEALGHMRYDDVAIAREFQNYYLNCIRDCDRHLGTVLDGLRQSGQLERTVIVFYADHGEFLGAHGLRGKGSSIYREASEVPLIIAHPEGKKGVQANAMFSSVDIIPTLLGLSGFDYAALKPQLPTLIGQDQSLLAADPQRAGAREQLGVLAYWTSLTFLNHENVRRFDGLLKRPLPLRVPGMLQMMRETVADRRGAMRGVISRESKFARYFSPVAHNLPTTWEALNAANDIEFYDLRADPGETNNLALDPQHRDRVMTANSQLNQLISSEIGVDDGRFLPLFMRI